MASAPTKSSRCATLPDATHIVLVPGLEAMMREADRHPGLVARMLARGRKNDLDPARFHAQLLFGQGLAPAALTRVLDCPDDAAGIWLRADPVGLVPDLGAVWLNERSRMEPDSPAIAELVALFADEGFELDFPVAERGYLRLPDTPDCRFVPPWRLAGESMDHVWPVGPEAGLWRRLLNESQMILHQFSGSGREQPGSLWFWGGGELPVASPSARVNRVKATAPELRAGVAWAGLEEVPESTVDEEIRGLLLEWPVDHAIPADANLTALTTYLAGAWRRLRFDRKFRLLELASESSVWRFSTRDAWSLW